MNEIIRVVGNALSVPHCIHIALTTRCNMACKECFYRRKKQATLTAEKLQKIIFEAQRIGVRWLAFGGGEPTLYPYITGMLVLARTYGLRTAVTTNGKQLMWLPADVIHISHDIMHLDGSISWQQRDAQVRKAIQFHRSTNTGVRLGLNARLDQIMAIPAPTLRMVDTVTLLYPKKKLSRLHRIKYAGSINSIVAHFKTRKIRAELSVDGCLYHELQAALRGTKVLSPYCSQGMSSMALNASGRVAACSNIAKTYAATSILEGWNKIKRKRKGHPTGCIMLSKSKCH